MLTIYCDGACEPTNPGGYATWGWVAYDQGVEVATGKGCVGSGPGMTNNRAEYEAVLQALVWAYRHGHPVTRISTDSKLVVEQSNGRWRVHKEDLQALCNRVKNGMTHTGCTLVWVPRDKNERADALSKEAYQDARRDEARERHGSGSESAHSSLLSPPRPDWQPSAPYIHALMAIDIHSDKEVSEWEATFVADMLRRVPDYVSPKQARIVVRMAEHILGPAAAAELVGQQRLF